MTLFRKLSVASICLTIAGQLVSWGGSDGTAETTAEIAMLLKVFGGGAAPAGGHDDKTKGEPAVDPTDPAALLTSLLK